MQSNITHALASYAAASSADRLPEDIRELARKLIFDELAGASFSRRAIGPSIMARYAVAAGGAREARVLGTSDIVAAPYAALANGTAGHGEEVDGAHVVGGHPGATVVHAAMAMAERQRARGADYLNAVVLGYDVGVRASQACGALFRLRDRFSLNADFLFSLGAAAAASRLMGLSAEKHCHAYALVTFQTSGLCALFAESRHISKSFYSGQNAFAGVSAALMASAGMEGNPDIFGARHGILDAWGVPEGRAALNTDLGENYAIRGANFKFLNAGYPIHAPIEAMTRLRRDHAIPLEQINEIAIGMPENAMRVVTNRSMPEICVEDMIAATAVQGGMELADRPFPAMLANPVFQRLRTSTKAEVDEELQRTDPDGRGARVTLKLINGAKVSELVPHPRGHSRRGEVSWDDLYNKWSQNFPAGDCDRAIGLAQRLDEIEDISIFAQAFCR